MIKQPAINIRYFATSIKRISAICAHLRKSACPVAPADLSASGGWYWGVPKIQK